jgi:hypothetical protein
VHKSLCMCVCLRPQTVCVLLYHLIDRPE